MKLSPPKKFIFSTFEWKNLEFITFVDMNMKNFIQLLICIFSCFSLYAQEIFSKRSPFLYATGVATYYFWEEDSSGIILPNSMVKPYNLNTVVSCTGKEKKHDLDTKTIVEATKAFVNDHSAKNEGIYKWKTDSTKVKIGLKRTFANDYCSVVFRKKNKSWTSSQQQSVLYFSAETNGAIRFTGSSDTIKLYKDGFLAHLKGHYVVYTFLDESNNIGAQRVYNYYGEDVTDQLLQQQTTTPIRALVFINGYRGPQRENDPSDNLVQQNDRYTYWFKFDERMKERMKPAVTYYLDASFSVKTSTHQSELGFAWSWLKTKLTRNNNKSKRAYQRLNTFENVAGFNYRKEQGKIAGKAFIYAIRNSPSALITKDTVDIVCHSMGYSYMLGMLEVIQEELVLGKCFIIAPENAFIEGYDWNKFISVWQYGSNLDQTYPDPVKEQDGVAPQFAVKGIENLTYPKGGRVFIPTDWPNKAFIHSHMIYSYDWMFDRIFKGMPGYVGK